MKAKMTLQLAGKHSPRAVVAMLLVAAIVLQSGAPTLASQATNKAQGVHPGPGRAAPRLAPAAKMPIDPSDTLFVGIRFINDRPSSAKIDGKVFRGDDVISAIRQKVRTEKTLDVAIVYFEPSVGEKEAGAKETLRLLNRYERALRKVAAESDAYFVFVPCTGSAQFDVIDPKGQITHARNSHRDRELFDAVYHADER